MLHLKRITHFNEFIRCHASDQIMMYGDFYYEDDEDGFIVSAKYYNEIKKKAKEDKWDYSKLNYFTNDKEYQQALHEKEKELFTQSLLERKIYGNEIHNMEVDS